MYRVAGLQYRQKGIIALTARRHLYSLFAVHCSCSLSAHHRCTLIRLVLILLLLLLSDSGGVSCCASNMHDFDMNTLPEDVCTDQSDFFSEGDATKSCQTPTTERDQECNGAAKKLRLSHEQAALLEQSFNELGTLNPKQKNALAKQLKMRPRQVEVWFQNRRARTKLKQTEVECEYLKRCCDSLTEENKRLEREIRELRAFKMIYPNSIIDHHLYTSSLPAATLTMCPSCQRLSAPHKATRGIGNKPICCLADFTQSPKD